MDVLLHHCHGVPEGSILSVRAGSTRRQAIIQPGRPIHFAQVDSHIGEIQVDILQLLGRAKLILTPETNRYDIQCGPECGKMPMTCELEVRTTGADDSCRPLGTPTKVRLPEKVLPPSSNSTAPFCGGPAKAIKAKKYMEKHRLEEVAHSVVQAAMQERPEDPLSFMARKLLVAAEAASKGSTVARAPSEASSSASLEEGTTTSFGQSVHGSSLSVASAEEVPPEATPETPPGVPSKQPLETPPSMAPKQLAGQEGLPRHVGLGTRGCPASCGETEGLNSEMPPAPPGEEGRGGLITTSPPPSYRNPSSRCSSIDEEASQAQSGCIEGEDDDEEDVEAMAHVSLDTVLQHGVAPAPLSTEGGERANSPASPQSAGVGREAPVCSPAPADQASAADSAPREAVQSVPPQLRTRSPPVSVATLDLAAVDDDAEARHPALEDVARHSLVEIVHRENLGDVRNELLGQLDDWVGCQCPEGRCGLLPGSGHRSWPAQLHPRECN